LLAGVPHSDTATLGSFSGHSVPSGAAKDNSVSIKSTRLSEHLDSLIEPLGIRPLFVSIVAIVAAKLRPSVILPRSVSSRTTRIANTRGRQLQRLVVRQICSL
jgi:hypothetical protein